MCTPSTERRLGLPMLLCGVFLTGFVGVITFNLAPMLLHPGQDVYGGRRFTGDADQARTVLQIFWLVIAVGAAAMAAGTWQMVTGRRDHLVMLGVLPLAAALFLAARGTMTSLGWNPFGAKACSNEKGAPVARSASSNLVLRINAGSGGHE